MYGPCANLLLANGIAVTSHAGMVQAHFDSVDARGSHCMIDMIQPVDSLRMQRDLRKNEAIDRAVALHGATDAPVPSGRQGARH